MSDDTEEIARLRAAVTEWEGAWASSVIECYALAQQVAAVRAACAEALAGADDSEVGWDAEVSASAIFDMVTPAVSPVTPESETNR